MTRALVVASLSALAALSAFCAEPEFAPLGPHPRLFADTAEFEAAKTRLASSDAVRKAFDALMLSADAALGKPVVKRKMAGRRLLSTSREALARICDLSFAWRMTGERKYAERAIAETKAVAAFADWNPSHFLDVAEMTLAVAVARDWLDDALEEADKRLLAEAILMKGLTKGDGKTLHSGWWTTTGNNWNQVCHGGLSAGAAAVREDFPEIAEEVLRRARKCLPKALKAYAGGNFPEGPGYWIYASDYAAVALDTLSRQFADGAQELFKEEGLVGQLEYMDLMTGPTGLLFNYSDPYSRPFAHRSPVMANCYFGMRFGRPDAFALEVAHMSASRTFGRLAALALLWSGTGNGTSASAPALCRSLGGSNPIAVLRTGLGEDDWYVGVKGGRPSANHGHMDGGSFVLDAGGVRWACDLGCENYGRIEAMKTIDLWNLKQDSSRWSLFRLGVDGHGTLTIDGAPQKVDGCAAISPVAPAPPSEAAVDLSSLYPGAAKVTRTFILHSDRLLVRDWLSGLEPDAVVAWNMNTSSKATAHGNVLELEAVDAKGETKKMTLTASPDDVKWTVSSIAEPRTPADSPNPGISRVAFSVVAGESGEVELSVSFALSPEFTTCLCGEAPERANDFFWENDRTGFRAYGPGDVHKWSGIDVFNKATTNNFVVHLLREPKKHGNWHKNVNGLGMDDYAVGPGRGVGGVALRKDGKWLPDYGNWTTCRVLTNSEERCSFELDYKLPIGGVMTLGIVMEKGSSFFTEAVTFSKNAPIEGVEVGVGLDLSAEREHTGDLVIDEENLIVSLFEKPHDREGEEGSMMNAIFAVPGMGGVSLANGPEGANMIMTEPLKQPGTALVVCAGADWTEAGRFRDAKAWHDYVRDEQAAKEQAVSRIFKTMLDSKSKTQTKGKDK